jgi:hypothetical protein
VPMHSLSFPPTPLPGTGGTGPAATVSASLRLGADECNVVFLRTLMSLFGSKASFLITTSPRYVLTTNKHCCY